MKYNHLGRTDIAVSEICLGTMTWGSQNTEAEAHEQMDHAVEKGVNFVDTAELYPTTPLSVETQGRTEEYIGSWFAKTGRRRDIVLATKVAGKGRDYLRNGQGADAANIRAAVDASLKRLKTDSIDLYQVTAGRNSRGHFHFLAKAGITTFTQDREKAIAKTLPISRDHGRARQGRQGSRRRPLNETTWASRNIFHRRKTGLPRIVLDAEREYNSLIVTFDLDLAELSHYEKMSAVCLFPRLPAAFQRQICRR